jgi:hypothetical protein
LNHDLYASNPILTADIRRIIEKGERLPDKRTKEFEAVTSEDGTYWRLPLLAETDSPWVRVWPQTTFLLGAQTRDSHAEIIACFIRCLPMQSQFSVRMSAPVSPRNNPELALVRPQAQTQGFLGATAASRLDA